MLKARKLTAVLLSIAVVMSSMLLGPDLFTLAAGERMAMVNDFEVDAAGQVAAYYGNENNAPKVDYKGVYTQPVSEPGIGHGASAGALRLSYTMNHDGATPQTGWRAVFSLANTDVAPYVSYKPESGKYYRISLWVKAEKLTTDADLRLVLGTGSLKECQPASRDYTYTLAHLAARETAGDWMQVSAVFKGLENKNVIFDLDMADHRSRMGSSLLIDDIAIEEIPYAVINGFEADAAGQVAEYYGNVNNAPKKDDLGLYANLVSEAGTGQSASAGVMRLSYTKNHTGETPATDERAVFSLADTNLAAYKSYKPENGKYYRICLWYKAEKLTTEADLLLVLGSGALNGGYPNRQYTRSLAHLAARDTAGEWTQVSAVFKGLGVNVILDLDMADHRSRAGSSLLIDDVTIEEIPLTVENNFEADTAGRVAAYYGNVNNAPKQDDLGLYANLVNEAGSGHNASFGAMRLSYTKNHTGVTPATGYRAVFSLANTNEGSYNSFKPEDGKYYRINLWVKAEKLTTDADLLLVLGSGRLDGGLPARAYTAALAHLAARDTAGEWTQVSAVFKGLGTNVILDLNMADHWNRAGSSILIDDVTIEALDAVPVQISFQTNGGSAVDAVYGLPGEAVTWPPEPTGSGLQFDGWYHDEGLHDPCAPDMVYPDADTTLYAKWVPKALTQDYEGFDARDYDATEAGGVHGNGAGRTVSEEYNHTPGGSKSVKLQMNRDTKDTYAQTIATFGGTDLQWVKGGTYTVSFWICSPQDVTLTWRLASAGGPLNYLGQYHQIEKAGSIELKAGQWRQVTAIVTGVIGTQGNNYLTIGAFHNGASDDNIQFAYIDDVEVNAGAITHGLVNDFEADAGGQVAGYYGNENNAPQVETKGVYAQMVSEAGIGHDASAGAMRLSYAKNHDGATPETGWRAVFSIADTNADPYSSYKPKNDTYYRISLWVKTEKLTADADLQLVLGMGSLKECQPATRDYTCTIAHMAARDTAGEWTQVSAVFKGLGNKNVILDLNMTEHRQRLGSSVLLDDIVIEELHADPVKVSFVSDGGAIDPLYGLPGEALVWPRTPAGIGLRFGGWYRDEALHDPCAPDMVFPDADTTLYAKWTEVTLVQDYESYEARDYGQDEAGGVHGNGSGRTVSAEYNHTPNGSKSVKLKMNRNTPESYAQTIATFDGADLQWTKGGAYIVSFWLCSPQDTELTWSIATAGGPLTYLGQYHQIEKQGKLQLEAGEWQQVTAKIPSIIGTEGNQFLTIGAYHAGASEENVQYAYIDDVVVTPVARLPQLVFHTGVEGITVPNQGAFAGEPIGSLPFPSRDGYYLEGWCSQDYSVSYSSNTPMPDVEQLDLYARWTAEPTVPYSYESGFETDEYTQQPYQNDGVNPNGAYANMTASATWQQDAGFAAETGDGSMRLENTPFVNEYGGSYPAFALMNPDATRFMVVKGHKYRITYSYMGDELPSAHSYVSAVISPKNALLGVGAADQVLTKRVIHGQTDWMQAQETFCADSTGFVYITLAARSTTSPGSSEGHVANIDNVKVEVLDDSYVAVRFMNGGSAVGTRVGQTGTDIAFPPHSTKEGHEFAAWYTDAACTQKYASRQYPAADTVLYAGYEAADYTNASSDFSKPIVLSFEEIDLLQTWLWGTNHMTWNEDTVVLRTDDAANARTGKNYIQFNQVDWYYANRCLMLYDPGAKYNNLYLDPHSTYKISYWYKVPSDEFTTSIDFTLNFNDPSGIAVNTVAVERAEISLDTQPDEWQLFSHIVTTGDERVSVSLFTQGAGFTFALDDITIVKVKEVDVHFQSNGGTQVESRQTLSYSTIEAPINPTREGYLFDGWYTDAALTKAFDFETMEITDSITLYAKWKADTPQEEDPSKPVEPDDTPDDAHPDVRPVPDGGDSNREDPPDESIDIDFPGTDTPGGDPAIDTGARPGLLNADDVKPVIKQPPDTSNIAPKDEFPWLIVGLVSGAVVLIAAGLTVCLLLRRKRRHSQDHAHPDNT